jgi:hypothetical protein
VAGLIGETLRGVASNFSHSAFGKATALPVGAGILATVIKEIGCCRLVPRADGSPSINELVEFGEVLSEILWDIEVHGRPFTDGDVRNASVVST